MIVTTDRDATYFFDEILGNATDTHGQTLLTFTQDPQSTERLPGGCVLCPGYPVIESPLGRTIRQGALKAL